MGRNRQLNWMKFNVYDFMHSEDVESMSDTEVGQYCLLLFSAWCGGKNCTLPDDPVYLARKARCTSVSGKVLSKFEKDGNGRIFNRTQQEGWHEQQAKLASYSERGKKGNDKRWGGETPAITEGSLKDRSAIAEGLEGKGKEGKGKEGNGESADSNVSLASLLEIQVKDQTPDQVKRVVLFHWKYSQDPYWKNQVKSEADFISRFGSMLKQVPVDWKEPRQRTRKLAEPNCEKCKGEGGWYFDSPDGAKMWEDCPCLKRVAA